MKKAILIALMGVLFSTAYAQVDPAFTAKMINVVNTAEAYYHNQTPDNLQAALNAIKEFYPLTKSQFDNKLSAMVGSQTEMAKFSTPISFAVCVGQAASQLWFCYWLTLPQDPQDIPPSAPSVPNQCATAYAQAVAQCAVAHL